MWNRQPSSRQKKTQEQPDLNLPLRPHQKKRPNEIKFMDIQCTFRCTLLNCQSPSRIHVQPLNAITEDLQIYCPNEIQKELHPELSGNYVMAPLQEDLYARAQIRKIDAVNEDYVFVEFIDKAKFAWVHKNVLVRMKDDFFHHPWQSIRFCLFGITLKPKEKKFEEYFDTADEELKEEMKASTKSEPKWTEEHKRILKSILDQYSEFEIQLVRELPNKSGFLPGLKATKKKLNYHSPSQEKRMELFGINCDGKREAIAPVFAYKASHLGVEHCRDMYHALQQLTYGAEYDLFPIYEPGLLETWHKTISECWGEEESNGNIVRQGYRPESRMFDSFIVDEDHPSPIIETFTMATIKKKYQDKNGRVRFVVVANKSLKSPFEFYVFPLKKTADSSTSSKAIAKLMEDRHEFSEILSHFYVNSKNQKLMDSVATLTAVFNRKPVYAIYNSDVSNHQVPRFRRVMIYSFLLVSKDHPEDMSSWIMRVVFLDYGGTEDVPLDRLLQIHSTHCVAPPFTMQLICPINRMMPCKQENQYEKRLAAIWKAIVPTTCVLSGTFFEPSEKSENRHTDPIESNIRPNVLAVKQIKEPDVEERLDDICFKEFLRAQNDPLRPPTHTHLIVEKPFFQKSKELTFTWTNKEDLDAEEKEQEQKEI
ncbi:hypothetical protein L596_006187 [Steinernema carpocapsae]|uniref:Tudor domain-containing protein n=1 Tax=Steinernema carpocapsae TaxID=34508 RepID=A0A4V6I8Z8_STECR|nr:hypothetical protein L596_006187 [Steinernema carpocapsae]